MRKRCSTRTRLCASSKMALSMPSASGTGSPSLGRFGATSLRKLFTPSKTCWIRSSRVPTEREASSASLLSSPWVRISETMAWHCSSSSGCSSKMSAVSPSLFPPTGRSTSSASTGGLCCNSSSIRSAPENPFRRTIKSPLHNLHGMAWLEIFMTRASASGVLPSSTTYSVLPPSSLTSKPLGRPWGRTRESFRSLLVLKSSHGSETVLWVVIGAEKPACKSDGRK
mmetsp:Transcript_50208/g.117939  ORF Transcript_50208/g.117939 Transcript_50208/m.117939 type:complete len:226 (-) Transcript_50208:100-777(-)